MNFIPVNFYVRDDIVVVGQHFEAADLDNPHGYLFGIQYYVIVSNEHGDTYSLAVSKEEAGQLAERLNARWKNFKKLPLNFKEWQPGRAVYGSQAYIEYGSDEEIEWERRQEFDNY